MGTVVVVGDMGLSWKRIGDELVVEGIGSRYLGTAWCEVEMVKCG